MTCPCAIRRGHTPFPRITWTEACRSFRGRPNRAHHARTRITCAPARRASSVLDDETSCAATFRSRSPRDENNGDGPRSSLESASSQPPVPRGETRYRDRCAAWRSPPHSQHETRRACRTVGRPASVEHWHYRFRHAQRDRNTRHARRTFRRRTASGYKTGRSTRRRVRRTALGRRGDTPGNCDRAPWGTCTVARLQPKRGYSGFGRDRPAVSEKVAPSIGCCAALDGATTRDGERRWVATGTAASTAAAPGRQGVTEQAPRNITGSILHAGSRFSHGVCGEAAADVDVRQGQEQRSARTSILGG